MSIAKLNELELNLVKAKYPNNPYPVATVHTDKTANGLTKAVVRWIELNGGLAERISSSGRYIQGKTISKGFYGAVNLKGKFIKGTTRNGTADCSATFKNNKGEVVSWKIEIKMKDKMSDAQHKYAEDARKAGAHYDVVHNFDEFITKYNQLMEGVQC